MEPEILTPRETEIDHIQQKPYPIAPARYLNYIEVINTENVAKISVSQIKHLAEKLSPNDVFPQIKDFTKNQVQNLTEKILSIENTKFLDALCTIIFMCSEKGVDILERCGAYLNTEHQGEKVVLYRSGLKIDEKSRMRVLVEKNITVQGSTILIQF